MEIIIKTFATVRDMLGFDERAVTLDNGKSVGDVISMILKSVDELEDIRGKLLFAVNEEYCDEDRILKESDVLAVFPPVSGG